MRSLIKFFTFLITGFVTPQIIVAQPEIHVEDAIFWEVTGNNLKQPSYLFGTFHLLDNRYVDSLTYVMDKFNSSGTVVSELLMDSSMVMKLMMVSQMKGTTLDKLLSAEDYQKTAKWLKELMGYDLSLFNTMNPLTIQLILMASLQKKHYPMNPATDIPMDTYFQKLAKANSKGLVGLETLDEQVRSLFGQFSNERQAELLSEYVQDQEKAWQETIAINTLYRQQKLKELQQLMSDKQFETAETEVMLDNRNKKWMEQLPDLMMAKSTFVAVGALHLPGKNGLVNLLRKQGYEVRPLALK